MPLRLSEGAGAAPGDLMAFDVKTGKLVWSFHTIPHRGESGDHTWGNPDISKSNVVGAANNWAGMSLDVDRQILYVPTGSAAPDFYGAMRPGKNLFSNCLLALNANTGKLIWHYQFTHHDLWDRDPPAPPNLLTVNHGAKSIPSIAQVTKQGFVFLLDRVTGEPLFDIEEVPVPKSGLPGEQTWPTQPIPVIPAPFARQSNDLTTADISPYAPNRDSLLTLFEQADKRRYAPPSLKPVLLLPGYDGAAEWGGAGADPDQGILYINSNEMAWFLQMKAHDESKSKISMVNKFIGKIVLAVIRKIEQESSPADTQVFFKVGLVCPKQIQEIITLGKGMMPGFPQITPKDQEMLIQFLTHKTAKNTQEIQDKTKETQLPFNIPATINFSIKMVFRLLLHPGEHCRL